MAKFQIYQDRKGEFRWRFKASNGRIIAVSSEGYKRKSNCKHGILLIDLFISDFWIDGIRFETYIIEDLTK